MYLMKKRKQVIGIVAWVSAIVLLVWLASIVPKKGPMLFDEQVIRIIETFQSNWMTNAMEWITELGGKPFLIFVLLVGTAFFLFIYRSYFITALFVIIVPLSAQLNHMLKQLFVRERPAINPLVDAVGYSFPSGHSTSSMVVYGFFIFILQQSEWKYKKIVIVFFMLLILLIGISRIYLHAHYPTDVLAGFAFGFIILYPCTRLFYLLKQR